MAARPGTGTTAALMAGTLRERLPTGCGAKGCLAGHTSRAVKTDAPPKRLIAPGADNRPTGTAGYDDPSRWDDPNAAPRCHTPADLTGASGADRAGPGNPAGAKGLLLHAPGGRAAAMASGVSCRAGRASTAA
eukprot:scaffold11429_cov109-Isochrysis_galbana.AAC.1